MYLLSIYENELLFLASNEEGAVGTYDQEIHIGVVSVFFLYLASDERNCQCADFFVLLDTQNTHSLLLLISNSLFNLLFLGTSVLSQTSLLCSLRWTKKDSKPEVVREEESLIHRS